MSQHVSSRAMLYTVFAALIFLTGLTVWVAFQDFGAFNTPLALVIATIKALLVVVFFMEMRYGQPLTWVAAVTGLLFLALLIGLTMTDVASRGALGFPGT